MNQLKNLRKHSDSFPTGIYQHYKGDLYEVLGVGRHSETNEELVFYRCKYYSKEFGNNALWVRPFKMFFGSVEINGKTVPRFKLIG